MHRHTQWQGRRQALQAAKHHTPKNQPMYRQILHLLHPLCQHQRRCSAGSLLHSITSNTSMHHLSHCHNNNSTPALTLTPRKRQHQQHATHCYLVANYSPSVKRPASVQPYATAAASTTRLFSELMPCPVREKEGSTGREREGMARGNERKRREAANCVLNIQHCFRLLCVGQPQRHDGQLDAFSACCWCDNCCAAQRCQVGVKGRAKARCASPATCANPQCVVDVCLPALNTRASVPATTLKHTQNQYTSNSSSSLDMHV